MCIIIQRSPGPNMAPIHLIGMRVVIDNLQKKRREIIIEKDHWKKRKKGEIFRFIYKIAIR